MTEARIYLSPPDVGELERKLLLEAFDSNWVAPVGPDLGAFESQVADLVGVRHAVALNSGTAALHLALAAAGVQRDDTVLVPSFTFAATANAVMYLGARPVFVDSTAENWNIDPELVADELHRRDRAARLPRAVITVDMVHSPVQLVRPEWSSVADVDPDEARRTRERMRKQLGNEDVLIVGTHFPLPTVGRLVTDAAGEWCFERAEVFR